MHLFLKTLLTFGCASVFVTNAVSGSLSERLKNEGGDSLQQERKDRAKADIAVIERYSEMIKNILSEGTPVYIKGSKSLGGMTVWIVRDKLLELSMRKGGSRNTAVCGGRRPWGKEGLQNFSYESLETTPKVLGTSKKGTFEFKADYGKTIYEINLQKNVCLYSRVGSQKVQRCQLRAVDKQSEARSYAKHIKSVGEHCKRFYGD